MLAVPVEQREGVVDVAVEAFRDLELPVRVADVDVRVRREVHAPLAAAAEGKKEFE